MSRPVTLFTGQWADLPHDTMLQKARSFGYDGIKLACWDGHFEPKEAEATKTNRSKDCMNAGTYNNPRQKKQLNRHFEPFVEGMGGTMSFTGHYVRRSVHSLPPNPPVQVEKRCDNAGAGKKPPGGSSNGSGGDGPFDHGGEGGGWPSRDHRGEGWPDRFEAGIADWRRLLRALGPLMEDLGGFCHTCHKFFMEIVLFLVFVVGLAMLGWHLVLAHQLPTSPPSVSPHVLTPVHAAK